jgi:hypothetical protein
VTLVLTPKRCPGTPCWVYIGVIPEQLELTFDPRQLKFQRVTNFSEVSVFKLLQMRKQAQFPRTDVTIIIERVGKNLFWRGNPVLWCTVGGRIMVGIICVRMSVLRRFMVGNGSAWLLVCAGCS